MTRRERNWPTTRRLEWAKQGVLHLAAADVKEYGRLNLRHKIVVVDGGERVVG